MGSETYRIVVESPLLRPGLRIETEVSERYLVKTMHGLIDYVRQFNTEQDEKIKSKLEKKAE